MQVLGKDVAVEDVASHRFDVRLHAAAEAVVSALTGDDGRDEDDDDE
jgi:hypothetical protein